MIGGQYQPISKKVRASLASPRKISKISRSIDKSARRLPTLDKVIARHIKLRLSIFAFADGRYRGRVCSAGRARSYRGAHDATMDI